MLIETRRRRNSGRIQNLEERSSDPSSAFVDGGTGAAAPHRSTAS